jgi:phosphohistidine phosphatase SixA
MRWIGSFFFATFITVFVGGAHSQSMSNVQLLDALRGGGHVLLLRHAQTEPGVGDPPNFRLGDCRTQRNLSVAGRAQTRQIASQLKAADIRFDKTLTSEWCRCRDTANLIADRTETFPALNSFFDDRSTEPKQTAAVRVHVKQMKANESWLLVTHQVNISALTGVSPAMGEGVVVRVKGGEWKVLGNLIW